MAWFYIYVYSCILPKVVSNSSRQQNIDVEFEQLYNTIVLIIQS